MAIWDGIESAKGVQNRPFLEEGDYTVKFDRAREGKSFKGKSYLAIDIDVVAATEASSTKPGTAASLLFTEDPYKYYLNDIKAFVAALVNEPPQNVNGSMVAELVSDQNPAGGTTLKVSVKKIKNGKGNEVKKFLFQPDPAAHAEPEPVKTAKKK